MKIENLSFKGLATVIITLLFIAKILTIIADLSPGIPDEPEILPEEPDNSPVWYQYDQSGNRIKTNKK